MEQQLSLPFNPPLTGRLIAFSGRARAGKSTAARILVEEGGFHLVKFADPLKKMIRVLFEASNSSPARTEQAIEGCYKETPLPELGWNTPRVAMQTLGEEWGRQIMGEDLWTEIYLDRVYALLSKGKSVVTDDVRYPNEAGTVRALKGTVVSIFRDYPDAPSTHTSEVLDYEVDDHIPNILDQQGFEESIRARFLR